MKYKNIITRKRENLKSKLNKFFSTLLFKCAIKIKTKNTNSFLYRLKVYFEDYRICRRMSDNNTIPHNDQLFLKKTSISEMFPIEDIDILKNGFKRLLKKAKIKKRIYTQADNYERIEKSINSSSQNISGKDYYNIKIDIDFTENKNSLIEYATFQIIRPLDTFIVLNIIVTPSVVFLNEFEKIINTQFHVEQVLSIYQLIKSGFRSFSTTSYNSLSVMNEKLDDLLCELKHEARNYFSKYFKGLLFLKNAFPPSIDFFIFNKHQQDIKEKTKEIERENLFWNSFESHNQSSFFYDSEEMNKKLKIMENKETCVVFTNYMMLIKNDSIFPTTFDSFNEYTNFIIPYEMWFLSPIIIYDYYIHYLVVYN